jgi:hypothetical protein
MLVINDMNINFNATSKTENDEVVANFYANYSQENRLSLNDNIEDFEKYLDNKSTIDADYEAFKEKVIASINKD